MKIFRWSGFIGFIIFTAVLGLIGFLFIDGWTKKAIEAAGFGINGAEVNVDKVNLTLSPIGFDIQGLQIADAEKPTHNALELGQLRLDINLPQLFLGNVRINDLTVADVQTNVERRAVARVAPLESSDNANADKPNVVATATTEAKNTLAGALPEPASVLDEQTQNTQSAIQTAEQTLADAKRDVESSVEALPDDASLQSYEQRIAEIKAIKLDSIENVQRAQQLLESVKKDLATDKQAIATVKREINAAVAEGKQAVSDTLAAPGKDWQQLQEDYPLNADSAVKVAQLLLGDDFFARIDQAKYWYGKAKPWLARLKSDEVEEQGPQRLTGQFVRFYDPDPTAKFQLDNGLVSFVADDWPWQLSVSDLTSEQREGSPMRFNLRRGEAGNAALNVDGLFDLVDGQSVDTFNFSGQGIDFAAQSTRIGDAKISWAPESADVIGQVIATNGALDGVVELKFGSNRFDAQGSGKTAGYLQSALKTVNAFSVAVEVSGTVKKPKFNIVSNLDNQLSSALAGVAKAEYEAWLADVKQQLDAKVAELRAPLDTKFAELTGQRDRAQGQIDQFEQKVTAEVEALQAGVEAKRQAIEGQLQAELDAAEAKLQAEKDAAEAKLQAEKAAAEAAAKKAAEDKLKEEAGKLTDKIKF